MIPFKSLIVGGLMAALSYAGAHVEHARAAPPLLRDWDRPRGIGGTRVQPRPHASLSLAAARRAKAKRAGRARNKHHHQRRRSC